MGKRETKPDFNSPRPFAYQGAPTKKDGVRFISAKEAVELCDDPETRRVMDIIQQENAKNFPELFAGKPLGVKKVFVSQCKKEYYADLHAETQKKIIDIGIKKNKMR